MDIVPLKPNNKEKVFSTAIATLKAGGLVIYPTETCYGIAADATNQEAIDRLLRYKTKRGDKPLSIAVTDEKMAKQYVQINSTAKKIYRSLLPGPITVISKGKNKVARGVESSRGTQAIRIPDYPFVLELIKRFNKPITATSANASYKKTPYAISDIVNNLSKKQKQYLNLIIDAGTLPKRKPSTIIDTTLEDVAVLREGDIKFPGGTRHVASSLKETESLVSILFKKIDKYLAKKTIIFLLHGELGAGKTHFTQYIGKKMKIKEIIVSPTYTICREYNGVVKNTPTKLQHIDAYRLYDENEIKELKPEVVFKAPNVVSIEWANKIEKSITPYTLNAVVITVYIAAPSENKRIFTYSITAP